MLGSEDAAVTQAVAPRVIWFPVTVLTLMFLGFAAPASAYTYRQVGVTGDLVIHEGKVYFGQSDDSLTALDLETGRVVLRKKNLGYARALWLGDSGILMESSRGIVLLEPTTLDVIRTYTHQEIALPRTSGQGELVPDKIPIDDPETTFTRFTVEGGTLMVRPPAILRELGYGNDEPVTISLEAGDRRWTGTLPYLRCPGTLFAVGSTADRILLGSNLGHVECIDARTGRSLWMYVFPTIRHTMSYSTYGMPPYMATAAAIYKRENRSASPESGMVLDGSAEPSRPMIIRDPSPSNPFEKLGRYLAIAWFGALCPLVLVGLILWVHRRSPWDTRIRAGLSLALMPLPVACFWFYGRVSLGSSIALRVGMFVPLLAAVVYAAMCIREKRWISSALILLSSAAIAAYLFPAFIHL
jgi:hypothetical protein